MNNETGSIDTFWAKFLASIKPKSPQPASFQSWAFGSTKESANELVDLVMAGRKTATSSLVWCYEYENSPLPKPGEFNLILDGEGRPVCVTETVSVEIKPFNEVGAAHACEEGEGDLSLRFWREVHWRSFVEECADIGREPEWTMPVCCERFRLCYPTSRP